MRTGDGHLEKTEHLFKNNKKIFYLLGVVLVYLCKLSESTCALWESYHDELVEEECVPVGQHLLCNRLVSSEQQLRIFPSFHRFLDQIFEERLQNPTKIHYQLIV